MNSSYVERQTKYQELCNRPANDLPGFVLEYEEKGAKHTIIGEDHEEGSALAIQLTLERIIKPGSIVIRECPLYAENYEIKTAEDLVRNTRNIKDWEHDVLPYIIDHGAHFIRWEQRKLLQPTSKLLEAIKQSQDETERRKLQEEFMTLQARREFGLGQLIQEKAQAYDQVIAVIGALHVLSPVLHRVLKDVPHKRYIYCGFK